MKSLQSDSPLSEFERLTCMDPYFAADHILNEVRGYYWVDLPAYLEEELASRAVTVFARNQRLRKRFQSAEGPDYLRMFMRHWLASLLGKHKHPLFRELPDSFKWGQPLPGVSPAYLCEQQALTAKAIPTGAHLDTAPDATPPAECRSPVRRASSPCAQPAGSETDVPGKLPGCVLRKEWRAALPSHCFVHGCELLLP